MTIVDQAALQPYIDHVRALPFVRGVRVLREPPKPRERADYEIEIRGPAGTNRMLVELKTSNVSSNAVERWADTADRRRRRILFAPSVGRRLGDELERSGISFVDRAGNCYLDLAGKNIARVQGRAAEKRAPAEKALRGPAYSALFALLADPKLVSAPVRTLPEAAGVSRQAAFDIRPRLEALGILYRAKTRFGWTPRGAAKALDVFVTGYVTTLRPQLVIGRYRVPGSNPDEVERGVARALKHGDNVKWGGGVAAMKLTGYYRGERTLLHMNEATDDFLKRIKAIRDRNGTLEIVRFPGPLAANAETPDAAHPLLVYAELMIEGNDRAAEAAQQIQEQWLAPERYA
jgi:hypothetical protein